MYSKLKCILARKIFFAIKDSPLYSIWMFFLTQMIIENAIDVEEYFVNINLE